MNKTQLKNLIVRKFSNKFFVASVLFLTWIFFFDEDNIIDHMRNKHKLRELVKQKEYYHEQIASDKQKLDELKSGIEELEKFAREQYHMSLPDEDVFLVIKD